MVTRESAKLLCEGSIPFRASMKEKYIPTQSLKKGIEITELIGKNVYEAVKPRLKRQLILGMSKFLKSS